MDIYGRATEAADNNIMWRIRIACWIAKATDTHSEYVILLFYYNSGLTSALQFYDSTYIAVFLIILVEHDTGINNGGLFICLWYILLLRLNSAEGHMVSDVRTVGK